MGDKSPKSKQRDMKQKGAADKQSQSDKDKKQQGQAWIPTKPKR